MNYLKQQKNNHVHEMKDLEVKRNQQSHVRAVRAALQHEKKAKEEENNAKLNKLTIDEELRVIREETADERWEVHAAWEVRKYGYVVSNDDEWKKQFTKKK